MAWEGLASLDKVLREVLSEKVLFEQREGSELRRDLEEQCSRQGIASTKALR